MIRRQYGTEKWLMTPQAEHARISGLIAVSWNFAGPKPHEEVFLAISRHDDGWKQRDERPLINRVGDPAAFDEVPFAVASECWIRSVEMLEADRKYYAAQLVAQHFLALARQVDVGRVTVQEAVAVGRCIGRLTVASGRCQKLFSKSTEGGTGITEGDLDSAAGAGLLKAPPARPDLDRDLRFLQICDQISILLCSEFRGERTLENVPYTHADTLVVSRKHDKLALNFNPLPFKKNLRDHCSSFLVSCFVYESDEELQAGMAELKLISNEIHLGAAS